MTPNREEVKVNLPYLIRQSEGCFKRAASLRKRAAISIPSSAKTYLAQARGEEKLASEWQDDDGAPRLEAARAKARLALARSTAKDL